MPFRRADTRGYGCCLYITKSSLMHRSLFILLLLVTLPCSARRWLSPPFRVALHRPVRATSSCGRPASRYCPPEELTSLTGGRVACRQLSLCAARIPGFVHTPEKVVDGLGFSWWQSEVGVSDVSLVVSLQRSIQVARIRVAFKVPPGKQWTIQRSRDGGRSFTPWHYFVESESDCRSLHGLPVDRIVSAANASCSVSRSSTGFQVVDLLKGRPGAKFRLPSSVQDFITTDAVRLDLLQFGEPFHLDSLKKQGYYAIREIGILGRCWCCGPSLQGSTEPCQCCTNNYSQKNSPATFPPIQATARGYSFKGCTCNEAGSVQVLKHKVQKCRIGDQEVESERCLCKINVVGRRCNRCKAGYYQLEKSNPVGCQECGCNEYGSVSQICRRTTGQCFCRRGYTGRLCDQCKNGKTSFPICRGCGNCSAYLGQSLHGFRREVTKRFKMMKQNIPFVTNVTHEKALELAAKQRVVLNHLDAIFGNVNGKAEAVIEAISLFEWDVFDTEILVKILSVKSEHVKVSVSDSWNETVQLLHRTRSKANRVTDLIVKVRNLSRTLEVAVNEDDLMKLKKSVKGINQVNFTEQEHNTLECQQLVNQMMLQLKAAWNESTGLYKAANNTLQDVRLYTDMLKDIIVTADIMSKTLVGISWETKMSQMFNFYVETRVERFPAEANQIKEMLERVQIEIDTARDTYARVDRKLEVDGALHLKDLLEYEMKQLAQRLKKDPELLVSVMEINNYSLQLTSDLQAMERYYCGLIDEGHPAAVFFHTAPLIVHQADSALSHAKTGQSVAVNIKRESRRIKRASLASHYKARMLLKQGNLLTNKLYEIYFTTLGVQYDVDSNMIIATLWKEEMHQVSIQLVETETNTSIRLRPTLQKSREMRQLARKQERKILAIDRQVSAEATTLKTLLETVSNITMEEQETLMLVIGAAASQKVTESIVSRISSAYKHVDQRLSIFDQTFQSLRQHIKYALKSSKGKYKEVRQKEKRWRKSRNNQV